MNDIDAAPAADDTEAPQRAWRWGSRKTMTLRSRVRPARKRLLPAALAIPVTLAGLAGCGAADIGAAPATTTTHVASEQPATADTTTEMPTTTTPPPPPPQVVHGNGDDVVPVTYESGPRIMAFSCPDCSANTVVQSDGFDSLLVNTIGPYSGKRWMDIRDGSDTSRLTVKADSAWTLKIGGPGLATVADGPVSGHGDDVVVDRAAASAATITNHGGSSNFVVQNVGFASGTMDLVVNTIGGYSGTDPIDLPGIIQITSDGSWSITPES